MSSNQTSSTDSVGSSILKKNSIPATAKPSTKSNNINLNLSKELVGDIEPNNKVIKGHKDLLKQELDTALMTAKTQLEDINNAISVMKNWVKQEYDIEDSKEWLQSRKESLSKHSSSNLDAASNSSSNKPIVRITLGSASKPSPSSVQSTLNSPSSTIGSANTITGTTATATSSSRQTPSTSSTTSHQHQHQHHSKEKADDHPKIGRGSKNLSRMMNRPTTLEERPKIPNQTPINVFWTCIESYFKNIEEPDLKFLDDPAKVIDPIPFTIPPLGRSYLEQWKELYGYSAGTEKSSSNNSSTRSSSSVIDIACGSGGAGGASNVNNFSLRERLVAMFIDESGDSSMSDSSNIQVPEVSQDEDKDNIIPFTFTTDGASSPSGKGDYVHVDDRIRQELISLGFEEFANSHDLDENDPICIEMRQLQQLLRDQVYLNHYRKKKLADRVRSYLPSQEFYSLLQDVNKQIELAYQRRSKQGKKKKIGRTPKDDLALTSHLDGPSSLELECTKLLEVRSKLLDGFKGIISPLSDTLACVQKGLFNSEEEEIILKNAKDTGSWFNIPDHMDIDSNAYGNKVQPAFPIIR